MKPDNHDGQREKKRFQFGLRALLVLMSVLGPLSGWYGPLIITHMRDLLVDGAPTNPPITPGQIQQQRLRLHQMETLRLKQMQARSQASQARIDAHRQTREAHRQARLEQRASQMGDGLNPLINRNGTFNMRYHLPPSEHHSNMRR
jgi:hypothetical protein